MVRSPCLPDPEKLLGLWSASGVEPSGERPATTLAPARIRFGAAPAPAPQAAPPPRGPPVPPAPPLPRQSLSPALAAAAALAGAPSVPSRLGLGPPLPPRVPDPPPAPRAPAAARPAVPALSDEVLGAQIFSGAKGIDARLQRLLEYTGRALAASAAFVADRDGLMVASLRSSEALAAVTAPLGGMQERIASFVPAPAEGAAVVELDQGVLQLVWAGTDAGRLALGMVLAAPLDRGSTNKLRRLVQLAVHTKGSA